MSLDMAENLDQKPTSHLSPSIFDAEEEDANLSSSTLTDPHHHHSTPDPTFPPNGSTELETTPSSSAASPSKSPRKLIKLTDADRRAICEHYQAYPATKQDQLGILFGVERSTVSKILKNKDKWLKAVPSSNPHRRSFMMVDESTMEDVQMELVATTIASAKKPKKKLVPPIARSSSVRSLKGKSPSKLHTSESSSIHTGLAKAGYTPTGGRLRGGRFPLLEESLAAWARSAIVASPAFALSDGILVDQARELALTFAECTAFKASPGWLEKFKERAGIKHGKFEDNLSPRERGERIKGAMRKEDLRRAEMDYGDEIKSEEDELDELDDRIVVPLNCSLASSRRSSPAVRKKIVTNSTAPLSLSHSTSRSKKTLSSSSSSNRLIANLPTSHASPLARSDHIPPPTAAVVQAELGSTATKVRAKGGKKNRLSVDYSASSVGGAGTNARKLGLELDIASASNYARSRDVPREEESEVDDGDGRRGSGGNRYDGYDPRSYNGNSHHDESSGSGSTRHSFSQDLSASFNGHLQSPFQSQQSSLFTSGTNSPRSTGMMNAVIGGGGLGLAGTSASTGSNNYNRHARSGSATSSISAYSSLTAFTSQPSSGASVSSCGSLSLSSGGLATNPGSLPSTPAAATTYFGHGPDGTQSQLQAAFLDNHHHSSTGSFPLHHTQHQVPTSASTSPRRATISGGVTPSFDFRKSQSTYRPATNAANSRPGLVTRLSQPVSPYSHPSHPLSPHSPPPSAITRFDHAYASLRTALEYLSTEGNGYCSALDLVVLADLKGKMLASSCAFPAVTSPVEGGAGGEKGRRERDEGAYHPPAPPLSLSPNHFMIPSSSIPPATSASTLTRSGSTRTIRTRTRGLERSQSSSAVMSMGGGGISGISGARRRGGGLAEFAE
jgi:hypothetical protein